jgi:hypothetical protein
MLKTIITFAALATLTATTIAPAHAYIIMNGGGTNGVWPNGGTPNGGGNNGQLPNGGTPNGGIPNGGIPNGTTPNGAESSSSTLTIQAIELPPETR